jgi:hypothetical protein
MASLLKPWVFVGVWLLLGVGVVAAYAGNQLSRDTLVFLGLCLVMLGAVGVVFWRKMAPPPPSIEEMLYGESRKKQP